MTEKEWLTCEDPEPMLKLLPSIGWTSKRKFRLFAIACCRLLLSQASVSPRAERVINVAEWYADGTVPLSELQGIFRYANSVAEHACMNAGEDECDAAVADCASLNAA